MAGKAQIVLGPCYKEGAGSGEARETDEIHIAAVHDVEGSRLEDQAVEPENIVLAGRRDVYDGRDRASKIELGMKLHAGLGRAEIGPAEERERQVDGARIQSVVRIVELQAKVFVSREPTGLGDEPQGQIPPQPPVASFVGVGESGSGDGPGEAQVVESFGFRIQTGFDVAETFAPCHLGKHHGNQLLATPKVPDAICGFATLDQPIESRALDQIANLGEDVATRIHRRRASPEPFRISNA